MVRKSCSTAARRFAVWRQSKARGGDLTIHEIAERTELSRAAVRAILAANGWPRAADPDDPKAHRRAVGGGAVYGSRDPHVMATDSYMTLDRSAGSPRDDILFGRAYAYGEAAPGDGYGQEEANLA